MAGHEPPMFQWEQNGARKKLIVGASAGKLLVRVLVILVGAALLVGGVVKLGEVVEAMRLPWLALTRWQVSAPPVAAPCAPHARTCGQAASAAAGSRVVDGRCAWRGR